MKPEQCHRILLPSPVLSIEEMNAMKNLKYAYSSWPSKTIDITFAKEEGLPGYKAALDRVCAEATQAIDDGIKVIVLSDRATNAERVALSALVACGGVHHHLVLQKKRAKVALMIETAEAREVHHICVLIGYGADATCPWLMMESIHKIHREGLYVILFRIPSKASYSAILVSRMIALLPPSWITIATPLITAF
jgi:glutamate synthase (NADH)